MSCCAFLCTIFIWLNLQAFNQVGWLLVMLIIPTFLFSGIHFLFREYESVTELHSFVGLGLLVVFWFGLLSFSFNVFAPEQLFSGNMEAASAFMKVYALCILISIVQIVQPNYHYLRQTVKRQT